VLRDFSGVSGSRQASYRRNAEAEGFGGGFEPLRPLRALITLRIKDFRTLSDFSGVSGAREGRLSAG